MSHYTQAPREAEGHDPESCGLVDLCPSCAARQEATRRDENAMVRYRPARPMSAGERADAILRASLAVEVVDLGRALWRRMGHSTANMSRDTSIRNHFRDCTTQELRDLKASIGHMLNGLGGKV